MRETDIAIVGAGLAGSLAAAMLGRAGHAVTLVDPFERCRPDFRCEKLEEAHVDALRRAGVLDEVLPAALRYEDIWVARLGRLAEVKPIVEYGIEYSALVNRLRSLVPRDVPFVQSKVSGLSLTPERQTLTLTSGEQISARLVIGANGVMADLIGHAARDQPLPFGLDRLRRRQRELAVRCADLLWRGAGAARRLSDAVSASVGRARQPVRLPRTQRSLDQAPARQSGGRDCGDAARTCAIHRPVARQWPAENPPGRSRRHRRSASARRSHWSATPSRPPARSAARAPPRRCSMPSACAMSTCRSGSRRPAWAWRRSRSSTTIPQKRRVRCAFVPHLDIRQARRARARLAVDRVPLGLLRGRTGTEFSRTWRAGGDAATHASG